jgi:predicted nucleic acid-binding protein
VLVIDASIAAAWAFPDEDSDLARRAAEVLRVSLGYVPALFWFEVRNLLLVGERRGRIGPGATLAILKDLDELPLAVDRSCVSTRLLELARQHRLTAYDAAYLELAERSGSPLATLDRQLAAAELAVGVPVLGSAA